MFSVLPTNIFDQIFIIKSCFEVILIIDKDKQEYTNV